MDSGLIVPPTIEPNLVQSQGHVDITMGIRLGDEGKGKGVHSLSEKKGMMIVVRYKGGANSAHTIYPVPGVKLALNHMPCSAAHKNGIPCLGRGMVVDPIALIEKEIKTLRAMGFLRHRNLFLPLIDELAHVVMPWHFILDDPSGKIGSTKRGTGPAYTDKHARRGIRMVDLLHAGTLQLKVQEALDFHHIFFRHFGIPELDVNQTVDKYLELGEQLRPHITDVSTYLLDALDQGHDVLGEGNQGFEIGVQSEDYPYVTSTDTTVGSFCTGTGVPPHYIREVYGLIKAYDTAVGVHPGFLTKQENRIGEKIRERGAEFGAATERPRDCGWLNVAATKKAIRENGVTRIIMAKLDVLTTFPEILVCVGHKMGGKEIKKLPVDFAERSKVEPIYETLRGWRKDFTGAQEISQLPKNARKFVDRLQELLGVPIVGIGTGPEPEHFIWRE